MNNSRIVPVFVLVPALVLAGCTDPGAGGGQNRPPGDLGAQQDLLPAQPDDQVSLLVLGVPPGSTLRIHALVANAQAERLQEVANPPIVEGASKVNLALPAGSNGKVALQVDALVPSDANDPKSLGCVVSRGYGEANVIRESPAEHRVTLAPLQIPLCACSYAVQAGQMPTERLCFENPLPQGNPLYAAYAAADNDVWFAGDQGTFLHFDGMKLRSVRATLEEGATGVGYLRKLFGFGSKDIWAVGERGLILHYDGTSWTQRKSGTTANLAAIWGSAPADLYVGGEDGTILRWNGTSFAAQDQAGRQALLGVHLRDFWGASKVYAVGVEKEGGRGVLARLDGNTWVRIATAAAPLEALWGRAEDNLWVFGGSQYRWNGSALAAAPLTTTNTLHSVFGVSDTSAWAVGQNGAIFRWNGTAWAASAGGGTKRLLAVTAATPQIAYAVSDAGRVLRFSGTAWTSLTGPEEGRGNLRAVAGSSPTNVWAVGVGGLVLRYAEGSWKPLASGVTTKLAGLCVLSQDEALIVGEEGTVLRWDGMALTKEDAGINSHLNGVYCYSPPDGKPQAWAVGDGGVVLHFNGDTWGRQETRTRESLQAIWGSGSKELWAVGSMGTAIRSDGASWTVIPTGVGETLYGVFGQMTSKGTREVWAVGSAGTALRKDAEAKSFAKVPVPTTLPLYGVWGSGLGDLWLVGNSALLRKRSASFGVVSSGTRRLLSGVYGIAPADIWVCGESATILRSRP